MIKQILYNCEADCTVLIRKPQVISRGGAHPLHPPPRSAPVFCCVNSKLHNIIYRSNDSTLENRYQAIGEPKKGS